MRRERVARLGQLLTVTMALATVLSGAGCASAVQRESERAGTPALPYRWGSADLNRKEFTKYLNRLDFTRGRSNEQPRKCKPTGGTECADVNDRTRLEISPEARAIALNPEKLDGRGHFVAVLRNYGNADEARYGLPANTDVYWLVKAVADSAESSFVWFEKGLPKELGPFPFRRCRDDNSHPNNGLETDFKPCPNAGGAVESGDSGEEASAAGIDDSPAWISCLAGCCVAGAINEQSQASHTPHPKRPHPSR